jgi:hypothetical protein
MADGAAARLHRAPEVWRLPRAHGGGVRSQARPPAGDPRVVQFILDVEDVLLIVSYALMAIEVWVVFWAIGEPIGLMEGLTIETFTRFSSVA